MNFLQILYFFTIFIKILRTQIWISFSTTLKSNYFLLITSLASKFSTTNTQNFLHPQFTNAHN